LHTFLVISVSKFTISYEHLLLCFLPFITSTLVINLYDFYDFVIVYIYVMFNLHFHFLLQYTLVSLKVYFEYIQFTYCVGFVLFVMHFNQNFLLKTRFFFCKTAMLVFFKIMYMFYNSQYYIRCSCVMINFSNKKE